MAINPTGPKYFEGCAVYSELHECNRCASRGWGLKVIDAYLICWMEGKGRRAIGISRSAARMIWLCE